MSTQMQVTVPAGVMPGMPFQMNTTSGPMQVTCPDGVQGGGQMIVNVPQAQSAQPAMCQPIQGAVVVAAQPAQAPVQQQMSRGKMDGQMHMVRDGCYCGVCYAGYVRISSDRNTLSWGPCCSCILLCCPCPIGTKTAIAPGSSEYYSRESNETFWFESPSKMRKFHPSFDSSQGLPMYRCC